MSKLFTIFLLLYGICQNTVAPRNDIKPLDGVSTGSENGNQNGYEEMIPADVAALYHHDMLATTTQLIAQAQLTDPSIIDNNDVIDVSNISTYQSIGREKRVANQDEYFVLRGSSLTLPCWRTGPSPFDKTHKDTKAIWRDSKNNALANSRYKLVKSGALQVRFAESSDTGKFSCRLKGTKKTSSYFKNINLKSIIPLTVYNLPTYEIDINFLFRVQLCPPNTKTSWLTEEVTSLVKGGKSSLPLKISSKCKTKANPLKGGTKESIQAVTVTHGMPKTYRVIHICVPNPSCIEEKMKTYLEMLARFVITKVQNPKPMKKADLIFKKWCAGGTWLYKKSMCLPCKAGTYSKDKSEKCTPCPKDKYQDKMGMKLCNKCPKGKSTQKTGSTSVSQCKAFIHLVHHSNSPRKDMKTRVLGIHRVKNGGKGEVTLRVSVNTVKVEHYLAIAVVPVIIILVFVLVCVIKSRKKDDEKKELRLDDQHVEVKRHAEDEYESEMGPTTEMETDLQTSGSELEVEQVRRHSIRSTTSGSKRNVNNSHTMPNVPSTCSDESLVEANNANFNHRESFRRVSNTMPQVAENPDLFYERKKRIIDRNICLNNNLPYSPFHVLNSLEVKNQMHGDARYNHHIALSTKDDDAVASSCFTKDFFGATEQVTKSIKVLSYPGMATYNNPACLPKAVTISKYSDAAIKDLFFIEPHNESNSICPGRYNTTNVSHNPLPSDSVSQYMDNFSPISSNSSSIQNGQVLSEHVLCNTAKSTRKELILSEKSPPDSNHMPLHTISQDAMAQHTTSDSSTSLETETSLSTLESEKSE